VKQESPPRLEERATIFQPPDEQKLQLFDEPGEA
jgi:hypothetical protein